jgi:PAS domain S-box-containing protein
MIASIPVLTLAAALTLALFLIGLALERTRILRQTNETLRASEDKFATAFRTSPDSINLNRMSDGMYLEVNDGFTYLTGYTAEDTQGKTSTELGIWADPADRARLVQGLREHGEVRNLEAGFRMKDGQVRTGLMSARLIQIGGETCILSVTRDIFELKQAEEEIRRKADTMTALYETTHDLVIEHDLTALLRTIVERAARLVRASGGGLYLCEPEQRQVRCVVSYNTPRDYTGVVLKYGEGAAGVVAETGEPLLVDDYRVWSGRAAVYEQDQPFVSLLSVPMRWQDRVIGVIHILEDARARAFGPEDLRVATLFANQAVIAIENSRLLESEQRRRREAAAIAEVGREITASLQLYVVLELIASHAKNLLRAETSAVYLCQPAKGVLRAIAALGQDAEAIKQDPLIMGEGILGDIAMRQAGQIVNDTAAEPRGIAVKGTEIVPCEHLMGVPVLSKGQLTALIAVWRTGAGLEFDAAELDFLSSLAGQVGVAIANASLFEETQKRLREMEAMALVSAALSRTLELEPLLENVLQSAIHAIPAAVRGSILLADEQDNLHIRAVWGYTDWRVRAHVFPPESGYATLSFRERRAIVISDVRAEARIRYDGDITEMLTSGSAIAAPLIAKDRAIGVIAVDTPARMDAFNAGDLHLLEAMSASVALAIENVALLEEARCRGDEFAALYQTALELADAQYLPSLLQTIVNRAAALFASHSSAIYLYDPARHDLELASLVGRQLPVGTRLAWGEGMAGRVAETRERLIVDDYHTWPGRSPRYESIPFSAALQVPMLYQGELIGVLAVSDIGPTTRKFTEADARLLSLFAAQAASAVHDASLRETLEQRVDERTRELAAANERLTELDQLKSKFVSDVSHELRTPVTNLNLYLDLLERGKPEKRPGYMAMVREQAARLTQLIEDILDLSRLDASAGKITFEPLDLNELVARVVDAQRPGAEAKGLALHFESSADNLPAIRGAASQLTQVVTNLVANAIRYTGTGSVTVATRAAGDRVLLEVRDTGMGVDAEDLPHLFERFYRGRRTAQSATPGTGLGLAIAKEIIEAHGGQIEVESSQELGSTFIASLPVAAGENP